MRPAATVTFARRIGLIGVAACFATTAAFAAGPRPDAAITNKSVDASVFLDDKIKADAALSADCLAEGRRWINKNAAYAAASRQDDPVLFRDGGWSFERKYALRSVTDGHYVSIVRSDYVNTGGAHPNSDVDTVLWNATTKKRISIRPFFTS